MERYFESISCPSLSVIMSVTIVSECISHMIFVKPNIVFKQSVGGFFTDLEKFFGLSDLSSSFSSSADSLFN